MLFLTLASIVVEFFTVGMFMKAQAATSWPKAAGTVTAVVRHGSIVHLEATGYQDASTKVPMEVDSLFRIYSMSKAITSAAAMMLSDEGKLRIDDPIAIYLPEFKEVKVWKEGHAVAPTNPPTVKDLLRHNGFQ